jgi:ABC-type spermidine/putrescine transport system permease subunit I
MIRNIAIIHSKDRSTPLIKKAYGNPGKLSEYKWIFYLLPLILLMVVFMIVPIIHMFAYSFYSMRGYTTIYEFTLNNYLSIFADPNFVYLRMLAKSLLMAGVTTIICLVLAYPLAYFIAKDVKKEENKLYLLLLFAAPFFAGELIRTLAISYLLGPKGLINSVLNSLGLPPIKEIIYTDYSVLIALIYASLPFMIIAIYLSFVNFDFTLIEVAKTYGATNFQAFKEVTLPLTLPGVFIGVLVVFIPALANYIAPVFVGGPESMLYGNILTHQFGAAAAWTMGSALSVVLTLIVIVIILTLYRGVISFVKTQWGL